MNQLNWLNTALSLYQFWRPPEEEERPPEEDEPELLGLLLPPPLERLPPLSMLRGALELLGLPKLLERPESKLGLEDPLFDGALFRGAL